MFERLDRVVANLHWLNLNKYSRVENLSITGSDHGPSPLDIESGAWPVIVLKVEAKWLL